MIDYKNLTPEELSKYYAGLGYLITANCGGILMELGAEVQGVFYKIDDSHFVVVKSKNNLGLKLQGRIFEIPKKGQAVSERTTGLLSEEDIRPVHDIYELKSLVGFWNSKTFEPSTYTAKH